MKKLAIAFGVLVAGLLIFFLWPEPRLKPVAGLSEQEVRSIWKQAMRQRTALWPHSLAQLRDLPSAIRQRSGWKFEGMILIDDPRYGQYVNAVASGKQNMGWIYVFVKTNGHWSYNTVWQKVWSKEPGAFMPGHPVR